MEPRWRLHQSNDDTTWLWVGDHTTPEMQDLITRHGNTHGLSATPTRVDLIPIDKSQPHLRAIQVTN